MDNLQQEIELRIESLKRAALEAMNLPEVAAYIKLLKKYADIKVMKEIFSIEEYNREIDALMLETDKAKEEPNVKMFIGIVESHRSLIETKKALIPVGEGRK